jgi:RNase H-fold protein (predicted Holliday junction resolvase)
MEESFILGLDVSTKTIGVCLMRDLGTKGELEIVTHVSPVVKPVPDSKMEELFKKVEIFEKEFLNKYKQLNITTVVIEEPLLQANNVYTVATLLRFNGMIAKSIYDTLGVVPEFISSYDARKYAFSELMGIRKFDKKGNPYTEKEISKKEPVLFGGYDFDVDKKQVIFDKVAEMFPKIQWQYDKKHRLKKESFDESDAITCLIGQMKKMGLWT